jgi:hypothetical protein
MGHWSWSRDILNGNTYIYTSYELQKRRQYEHFEVTDLSEFLVQNTSTEWLIGRYSQSVKVRHL